MFRTFLLKDQKDGVSIIFISHNNGITWFPPMVESISNYPSKPVS